MASRNEILQVVKAAQQKGDKELEKEALQLLIKLDGAAQSMPKHSMGPADDPDTVTPIEMPDQQIVDGENRAPTFTERVFNPAIETPWTTSDLAKFTGATAGSVLVPQIALPAALAKLGPLVPFLSGAGKIAGAGVGGGLGSAAAEKVENRNASLADVLTAGKEGAQDYAIAEAGGVGLGSALGYGAKKFFGTAPSAGEKAVLKYAQDNKLPLPISTIKGEGAGRAAEKISDLTMFGSFLRRRAANKISGVIEKHIETLTPFAKSADDIAPKAQLILQESLSGAKDAKNVAYAQIAQKVGQETPVDDSLVRAGIQQALQRAAQEGKSGPKIKALQDFLDYPDKMRPFAAMERFRKDAVSVLNSSKNYKYREIAGPVVKAFDDTYGQLGKGAGIDINASIKEANDLMGKLVALEKIPNIKDFTKTIQSPEGYIKKMVNPNNAEVLGFIKDKAPELHRTLIEQRLAMAFQDKAGKYDPKLFVKWAGENPTFIKEQYGEQTATVIKNFADYIKTTGDFVKANEKADFISEMARAALPGGAGLGALVPGAGFGVSPLIATAIEGSGGALAMILTRPNNPIYKVFAETDPVKVQKAINAAAPFVTRSMTGDKEVKPDGR